MIFLLIEYKKNNESMKLMFNEKIYAGLNTELQ